MVGIDRIGRWVEALNREAVEFQGDLTVRKAEKMIVLCELIKAALTAFLIKMKYGGN
jgi:hypothetical protein